MWPVRWRMVNKKSPAANTEMLYLVTLQDYQRGRFKTRLIVYVCVCVCVCADCGGRFGGIWCSRRPRHWWYRCPQWQLPTCRLDVWGWSWSWNLDYQYRSVCVCVCVCACMRVCVRACVRACVCVHARLHTHTYTCMCKTLNKEWIVTQRC